MILTYTPESFVKPFLGNRLIVAYYYDDPSFCQGSSEALATRQNMGLYGLLRQNLHLQRHYFSDGRSDSGSGLHLCCNRIS